MSYAYNNIPLTPGAYLVDGNSGANNQLYHLPIFSSIPSLKEMGYENVDNIYYILPGYKVERFNSENYVTPLGAIDNTNGTKIMYYQENTDFDKTTSIKLYYKNVEIPSVYTYAIYANNSGSITTTPSTPNTIGSYITTGLSIFPGAYVIDAGGGCMPIFYSIPRLNEYLPQTADLEDLVLVMPGYKLILWQDPDYTGTYVAIDNTAGTTIIVGQSSFFDAGGWNNNTLSAVQLYFNGNLINASDIVS